MKKYEKFAKFKSRDVLMVKKKYVVRNVNLRSTKLKETYYLYHVNNLKSTVQINTKLTNYNRFQVNCNL